MIVHEYKLLKGITERLPFALEETDRVNEVFLSLRSGDDAERRQIVALWTYCWVRRYYLQKLALESGHDPAAVDRLVSLTYKKIQKAIDSGSRVDRYASWVSVVCKNTFRNYITRKKSHLSADGMKNGGPVPQYLDSFEIGFIRQEVQEAIERLPVFLRAPARQRIFGERSYQEIAKAIDKDVAVARSYVSKALKRLRNDVHLMSYCEEADGEAVFPRDQAQL